MPPKLLSCYARPVLMFLRQMCAGQSKTANILFAKELNNRCVRRGAHACMCASHASA